MNSTILLQSPPLVRKWVGWWVAPVVVLVAMGIAAAVFRPWGSTAATAVTGQFYTVVPMDLDMKIVKDGELQAVRYTDVECKVEGTTTVLWLVKEGATVKKGDELVRLDSAVLLQRKENLDLDLQRVESSLKIATEMKDIQESQNTANLDAAKVALELANLDLTRYDQGNYPQLVADAETARDMALILLKNKQEDFDQTKSLYAKGFVTEADVKKAELDVRSQQNEVKRTEQALLVLKKYTYPMQQAQLKSTMAQAEQRVAYTKRQNAGLIAQRNADLEEKKSSLASLRRYSKKLQDQIDNCTIRAPEDGLVIYMSTIDRSMREPIQEGAVVRNTQTLLRLPDVKQMKVVLKIQESQKPKLDVNKNQRAIVKILGVDKPVGATLSKVSVLPDNSQRWWNPDLKEYPVELMLDETPAGLKPGTRADAEILVDRVEQTIAVPLETIYTAGDASYVFVRSGTGVKERKVTIGLANETHVQIAEGLSEGEQILRLQAGQGRELLQKAGIKTDEPTTQPTKSNRWSLRRNKAA